MNVRYGVCTREPCENRSDISALDFMVSNVRSDLHAQALASLSAARGQNGTATLGRHASTEAVALGPLAGVRLIGAFHVSIPFVFAE